MAKLTKCKGCGEEISKKAKSCPKCGEPIKKTHWFTWLVLGIIVFVAINPFKMTKEEEENAMARYNAQPKQVAKRNLKLDYEFKRSGFGNVLIADFKITNESNSTVKDIEIKCTHFAKSGTKIDSNTRTIYDVVSAHSTKSIKKQNMGFIHSQANTSSCGILDFVLVE